MKKFVTSLLAIFATLVMAVSAAAEDVTIIPEALPEFEANTSYSEKQQDEPDCKPNCEASIRLEGEEDY